MHGTFSSVSDTEFDWLLCRQSFFTLHNNITIHVNKWAFTALYTYYTDFRTSMLLIFLSTWIQVSFSSSGFGISSKHSSITSIPFIWGSELSDTKAKHCGATDTAFLSEEKSLTWLFKGKATFTYKLIFILCKRFEARQLQYFRQLLVYKLM